MVVIRDKMMHKINAKVQYFSEEIKGNFIILADLEHAKKFKNENEAKAFLKEHKASDVEILNIGDC